MEIKWGTAVYEDNLQGKLLAIFNTEAEANEWIQFNWGGKYASAVMVPISFQVIPPP